MNRKERRRQKKNTSQNQVNNSLLEAIQLHIKKDFENAEKPILKIIKNDQTNYQALRHLGILYNDTKKYEKGNQILN
jgi:Tfp pilus assembly protein PilF